MSRNSACLSPSTLYTNKTSTKLVGMTKRLTTTANGRGRNTAVGNPAIVGSQQTLALAYKTNAQMRHGLDESRTNSGVMTKSHSQINACNQSQRRQRVTQKLFAVDTKAYKS